MPPPSPTSLLLVDGGSQKTPSLALILRDLGFPPHTISLFSLQEADIAAADALILSGGPHLFTAKHESDQAELRKAFSFLKGPSPPTFGICLGFQALVWAAGGEVRRGPERRTEDRIDFVRAGHPLLDGIPSGSSFCEDHCEEVVLPPTFELLAISKHCPVEIAACQGNQRYGVQFHPESSGRRGKQLLQNALHLLFPPS
ncbi:MAG: hypothetical protein AAF191_09310 [Verrucomicrobiota bacterium]